MNVIPEKSAEPYFDFKCYRDKISDLNALKCLDLYLERTHVTAKSSKENDAIQTCLDTKKDGSSS